MSEVPSVCMFLVIEYIGAEILIVLVWYHIPLYVHVSIVAILCGVLPYAQDLMVVPHTECLTCRRLQASGGGCHVV